MPFNTRNARYLRISAHTVLPLYIYLDEKHVEWMSDYTLQRVLVDLKPEIGHKLCKESSAPSSGGSVNAKKGSVDVHRGDTYQFAYFFRKNEPHAVLIKSRKFVPVSKPLPTKTPSMEEQIPHGKRKRRNGKETTKARSRKKGFRSTRGVSEDEDEVLTEDLEDGENPAVMAGSEKSRKSGRKRQLIAGGYNDAEVQEEGDIEESDPELNLDDNYAPEIEEDTILPSQEDRLGGAAESSAPQDPDPLSSQILYIETEEEEKPKMALQVSYRGFTIYDRCLCIVIEPWPPLRAISATPSLAPLRAQSIGLGEMRMTSVAPVEGSDHTHVSLRERTPLFLPEIGGRRSLTPAPLPSRILPPVPLFDDVVEPQDDYEDNEEGMIAFSQVLKSVGDERAGSADEDDDEGDVFLGDADEGRGGP